MINVVSRCVNRGVGSPASQLTPRYVGHVITVPSARAVFQIGPTWQCSVDICYHMRYFREGP